MKRPNFTAFAWVLAAMMVLSTSSIAVASGGHQFADSARGADTVTVSLMTWADPANRARFQKSLDQLTEKTGVKVKIVFVPSTEITQKVNAMILSKTLPDVFWCSNLFGTVQPMIDNGQLFDWTDYISGKAPGAKETDLDPAQFAPGMLDQYKGKDGHQYGIPNEVNAYGFFYNADMFKAAGVSLPTSDWTWDDMFSAAQKLTVKDGDKTTQYGLSTAWPMLYKPTGLSMYSVSNGGASLAPQKNWIGVQQFAADATFTAGVKRFSDAIQQGYMTSPDYSGNMVEAFKAGKAPMMHAGQFFASIGGYFQTDLGFDWGFVRMPQGSAGHVAPAESNAFCSPKDLKNPDATWKVISWMLTNGFNDAYSVDPVAPIAYIPGSQGFFQALDKFGAPGKSMRATVEQELANPNKIGTTFIANWAPKADNLITTDWNGMLEGKKPVDEALPQWIDKMNKLITG